MAYSKQVVERFENVLNNPEKFSVGRFRFKLCLLIEAGYFTIEVVKLLDLLKTAGFFICAFAD